MPSRREFLGYAGATAGVVIAGCGRQAGENGAAQNTAPAASGAASGGRREISVGGRRVRTIDAHTHCFVGDAFPLVKDQPWAKASLNTLARVYNGQEPVISAERLAYMDKEGADTHILNIPPWWYPAKEEKLARAICEAQNKGMAAAVAQHPGRFLAYACVPLQFPEAAAETLQDAVKQGFVGAGLSCNVNGEEMSSKRFDPLWAAAQELNVPVFIHPGNRGGFNGLRYPEGFNQRLEGYGNFFNVIGHPLETTIALGHLIFEGTLDRFPGLRVIAAHGGGFIASYIERFDASCAWDPEGCRPGQKKPSDYFKSQIFPDSKVFSTEALRHLVATHGAANVVFGTDQLAGGRDRSDSEHADQRRGEDRDSWGQYGENAMPFELAAVRRVMRGEDMRTRREFLGYAGSATLRRG